VHGLPGVRIPRSRRLGLPIARQIAEGDGGTITVDSTRGAGTTFTVTRPADLAGS